MKGTIPRAGDKAIIIYSPELPKATGMVVDVVSDPHERHNLISIKFQKSPPVLHNQVESQELRAMAEQAIMVPVHEMFFSTNCLLKILPDEDAKKEFEEEFLDFTKPTELIV